MFKWWNIYVYWTRRLALRVSPNWSRYLTTWAKPCRSWCGNFLSDGKVPRERMSIHFPMSSLHSGGRKEGKSHAYQVLAPLQFSSVARSCLTLCDPMNHSTPVLSVHHQLLESTQTHIHWAGDAIQSSHPLSSPSPPALNLSQHQGCFQCVSSSDQVAKVFEFQLQHQSFQWTPRTDLLSDGLVGSPCSPRDSQESSPTSQFKSIKSTEGINSSMLSFLYSPNLTSIHDHWKNHSLD